MGDTTKTLLALFARRAFTAAGVWLVSKGLIQGDPSGFVGACMVLAEIAYEGWNRYGMVLVNAQLAKLKGVHPSQTAAPPAPPSPPTVLKVIAFFAVIVVSLVMVASVAMAAPKVLPPLSKKSGLLLPCIGATNLPLGCAPSAAAQAAAEAPQPTLASIMAQIEAVQAKTVADVIADINAADVDAGTVITPAIPATSTTPAVAAVVKDPIAHACYPALVEFLQSLPTANAPSGTLVGVQMFQDSRDFVAQIQAGIPTYLKLGCAPLLGDEVNIVIQALNLVGVKLGAAAIAAALPGLAPIAVPALTLTP